MARLSGTFRVGDLTVHQLCDGTNSGVRQSWFTGIDPAEWTAATGVADENWLFPVNFGGFVVTGDGHVTVIDTGFGKPAIGREGMEGGGGMLDRLAEIGIRREDVDRVMQTHLHIDHCGWLLEDDGGPPAFPNATVYVHQKEVEYWTTSASDGNGMQAFAQSRINPLIDQGKVSMFDAEHALSEKITLLPTPGHTPGHTSLLLASEGEHALLLGDVAHHPVHLMQHDWLPIIDLDPAESARSRRKMAELAVEKNALVTAPHMPILTLGRLFKKGDGFIYQAVQTPDGWNRERRADD